MIDPRRAGPLLHDPNAGNISVGGPQGIHIQGGVVHTQGLPLAPSQHRSSGLVLDGDRLAEVPGFVRRSPGTAAAIAAFGSVLMFVAPAVGIAVLGLPWLLYAVPALVGTALLIASGTLFARSRKYLATGGLDAETERRLLDVGVQYRGRVTVTAAARALQISLAEADAALTALARAGHVSVDNDPKTGIIVYVFPEIEAGLLEPGGPVQAPRRLS